MFETIFESIALGIFLGLITGFISGLLSQSLHRQKGYEGGFWMGFLLGIFGLIYSAGLPNMNSSKVVESEDGETIIVCDESCDEEIAGEAPEDVRICPVCGWQVFSDEKACSNCGNEIE